MAAHAVFIVVLGAICKDVEVVGIVFKDIVEFILVSAGMSSCLEKFT